MAGFFHLVLHYYNPRDIIMYFEHRVPLWNHTLGGICYSMIFHNLYIMLSWLILVPMQTRFTPFSHYYPDDPMEPLKRHFYMYRRVKSLQTAYTQLAPLTLAYIKIYAKKNIWSFPHPVANDLILGLPYSRKHSILTLHFPLRGYILSYYEALKRGRTLERKDTIL